MELSATEIGFGFALGSVVGLAVTYPAGMLADRLGRKTVIVPATVLIGVSMLGFSFAADYPWFLSACVVWGMAIIASGAAPAAYAADAAPHGMNAAAMSSYRMLSDVGYVVGPILLGWLGDVGGLDVPLWAAAVGLFLTAGLFAALASETVPGGPGRVADFLPPLEPAAYAGKRQWLTRRSGNIRLFGAARRAIVDASHRLYIEGGAVDEGGRRVTRGETYAVGGIGVALLGVVIASWADTRAGFTELRAEIRGVRTELHAEIHDESGVLRGEIGVVRGEIGVVRGEIGLVRDEIVDLRREVKQDIADLRGDVHKLDDRLDDVTARLVAVEVHTQALSRTPTRGNVSVVEDQRGDALGRVRADAD